MLVLVQSYESHHLSPFRAAAAALFFTPIFALAAFLSAGLSYLNFFFFVVGRVDFGDLPGAEQVVG